MAKCPTFPTLYDNCLQFCIKFLKDYGYLQAGQRKGVCNWSSNGNNTGSISFEIDTTDESPFVILDYSFQGEPRKYKVGLVTIPANIGKGEIWYLVCPVTKKRCRVLYSIDGYFLHRQAFKGCMYKIQTESKADRQTTRKYKPIYKGNEYDQLQAKHFKMFYNGKPTSRFLRIMKKIKAAEALPDPLFDKFKFRIGK